LAFNQRVLHEAQDARNPLLERVKFLAIVSSNLNEFFMKRIGGLKQQIGARVRELTVDGRSPEQQSMNAWRSCATSWSSSGCWRPSCIGLLKEQGIGLRSYAPDRGISASRCGSITCSNIFPLVTPQTMDPAHPFPFISNLSLNLLVTVRYPNDDASGLARIKVPVGSGIPAFSQGRRRGAVRAAGGCGRQQSRSAVSGHGDGSLRAVPRHPQRDHRAGRGSSRRFVGDDRIGAARAPVRAHRPAGSGKEHGPVHRGMLAAELGLDEASEVFEVDGMMALRDLFQIVGNQPARFARPVAPPARSSQAERQAQHFPHHSRDRTDPVAASL
jgi:polyphosphate kinase